MPYFTFPVRDKGYQISFDDLINGIDFNVFEAQKDFTYDTRTDFRAKTPKRLLEQINVDEMIAYLEEFNHKYENFLDKDDKSSLYRSFKIPKRSGGLRPIDAPCDELMAALRELKFLFEKKLYASYHTAAFAYVKGRCTIDAVRRHQRNKSRWFLKLDFHNFFGSTTLDFAYNQLSSLFPFSEIVKSERGAKALRRALSLCFLHGGLPQGTPISPTITNMMMIPIDYKISKYTREHTPHLCYTRYADDIILSSDLSFKWSEVQKDILTIVQEFNAPFSLNTAKTRYGSSAGRNWNLGVMLNKDNQITIGHQKKKAFKAMLFSLLNDYTHGIRWSVDDAQELGGLISYYKMVETNPITKIIEDYSHKFNANVYDIIQETITAKYKTSTFGSKVSDNKQKR